MKLDDEDCTLYKPDDILDWPVIQSTVHPFAMIWKAVSEFGLGVLQYDRLRSRSHITLMANAQDIYISWMKYAEANPQLWSLDPRNHGPSPPSTPGSRHPTTSSRPKRRRSDDDGDKDDDSRPSKRSGKSGSPRGSPDIVDEIPSMVSYSGNNCTQSFPILQSPSLVDRPVRVAAAADEDSDDDDEEYRPADLRPRRKFNISDWAKTASEQGEPVIEVECPSDLGVSEEP